MEDKSIQGPNKASSRVKIDKPTPWTRRNHTSTANFTQLSH